jgi:integrase
MGYPQGILVGYRKASNPRQAMPAKDTSYLIHRGNQWIVNVKVPKHLRGIIGKAHLRHPLKTDSLANANRLKLRIVADLKDRLEAAAKGIPEGQPGGRKSLASEAMEWRHDLRQAHDLRHDDPDQWEIATSRLADRAEEVEESEGEAKAKEFYEVARGHATPIKTVVDAWIAERNMKARQETDYKRAISKLIAWLAAGKHPQVIERITRRLAGQYVSEAFVAAGIHPRTTNKDISAIASLWKWSVKKGYANENVWQGQSLPKPKPNRKAEPRPFNDQEITDLFTKGKPSKLLRDCMTMAAFSGMRVEEIVQLTCGETLSGVFDITKAKTAAGIRQVPIHPALQDIVNRRTKGKAPTDPLFPDCPEPPPGSPMERSQRVVKQFVTHRRAVKVDDRVEGARQSRVNFHSFRRTFVTKAEQAGMQPHLIEVVVGHKRPGMALGVYSAGPLLQQLREVVESVKLPTQIP